jgi:predicted Zn-ribbon and HTH transcriptional regulator
MLNIEKLKKFRAELPKTKVEPLVNLMGQNDLTCTGCGYTSDYKDFKSRGQMTLCPQCKSDEINDFYGLPYNPADAKGKRRR